MRAPGGSIDEQQTGASGKEAGNSADATNMKEAVEDSFMLRNYGTEDGNEALQKTESGGV